MKNRRAAVVAITAALAAAGRNTARADDATAPAPLLKDMAPARSTPGWSRQANSLLLYGNDGALAMELPLPEPEESGTKTRETYGGASPDGLMAWTLERLLIWNHDRTALLESRRVFKLYGAAGAEMWRDESVDLPERGDPVQFSHDGKTLLLARHKDDGWYAQARTWLGAAVMSIGPFPHLTNITLSPAGRFALARWSVPDQSDTHTFIDLAAKARRDIPSADLVLGLARISDDGVVRSGSKNIFSFSIALSTTSASK